MRHILASALLCIFLSSTVAVADLNHTANSCSASDVQAAIDASANGDTVTIPECSSTSWGLANYQLSGAVNVNKGITLQGSGSKATNIVPAYTQALRLDSRSGRNIVLTNIKFWADTKTDSNRGRIYTYGDGTGSIRVTDITYDDAGGGTVGQADYYFDVDVLSNFLMDNCIINKYKYPQPFHVFSSLQYSTMRKPINFGKGWDYNNTEWAFFENNTITTACTQDKNEGTASEKGTILDTKRMGKSVWRYNTFIGSPKFLMHGICETSTGEMGGMAVEAYNNTLIYPQTCKAYAVTEIMSGTILFHHNDIQLWGTPTALSDRFGQADLCASGSVACINHWQGNIRDCHDSCRDTWLGGSACDGTDWGWTSGSTATSWVLSSTPSKHMCQYTWDLCTNDSDCASHGGGTCSRHLDNEDSASGRVCFQGKGSGGLIDGTPGSQNAYIESAPVYFWSNTLKNCASDGTGCGTAQTFDVADSSICDNFTKDSDFFNSTSMPGYTSYTYPHPLRGEADPDTIAPIRSALFPTTEQACDAESPVDIQIGVTTDEPATCKYDTSDVAYASMSGTFDGAGTTTHTATLSLACNATYTYYVRCQDDESTPNVNLTSSVISFNINPAAADTDPPGLSSVALGTDGRTLTLTFDEAIKFGAGGNTGVTITPTGGEATVAYQSGEFSTELIYYASRIIYSTATETLTVSYTQPGDGLEDGAGNDLATFSTQAVTNNSTQVPPTPVGEAVGIWSDDVTVGSRFGDGTRPFERGVRFTTLVPVKIHGIQFYKDAANTGTHTGNLWRTDRSLYTTVTFTGESASGWQTQLFPTPIVLDSGVSFIVSVFMPAGYCNLTTGYFTSAGVSNGLITFPASTAGAGNGMYKYTSVSSFPDAESGSNGNYWIDVLTEAFMSPLGKVQAGTGAGAVAGSGGGIGLQ